MYSRNDGSMGKLMVTESFNSLIFLEIFVSWCLLGIASGSSSLWVWVIISNQRLQGTHCRLVLFRNCPPLLGILGFALLDPCLDHWTTIRKSGWHWRCYWTLEQQYAQVCRPLLQDVAGPVWPNMDESKSKGSSLNQWMVCDWWRNFSGLLSTNDMHLWINNILS